MRCEDCVVCGGWSAHCGVYVGFLCLRGGTMGWEGLHYGQSGVADTMNSLGARKLD